MTAPNACRCNTTCNNATSTNPNSSVNSFANVMMFLTITAIVASAVQGLAPKKLLKKLPQPIIMMVLYLIAGVVSRVIAPGPVSFGVKAMVDPTMIQTLFLPVLMCSELFRMNTRAFFIVLWQLLLLIGPGLMLGAALTAVFPYVIMPSRPLFSWNLSMAFGGMLATTDPIAM
jgi:NhaP-type Na+/H+ or K+/H+ antiporter